MNSSTFGMILCYIQTAKCGFLSKRKQLKIRYSPLQVDIMQLDLCLVIFSQNDYG